MLKVPLRSSTRYTYVLSARGPLGKLPGAVEVVGVDYECGLYGLLGGARCAYKEEGKHQEVEGLFHICVRFIFLSWYLKGVKGRYRFALGELNANRFAHRP